eukprot:jgi/Chlat1/1684/Chrsp127S01955
MAAAAAAVVVSWRRCCSPHCCSSLLSSVSSLSSPSSSWRRRAVVLPPPRRAARLPSAAYCQLAAAPAAEKEKEEELTGQAALDGGRTGLPGEHWRKKKVALMVGYVGTGYRAIEDHLERAILAIGGMRPENYGSLGKIGWARSSRTDKGVHSVSTFISLKLECDVSMFERSDPEGQTIAAALNAHLPPAMRVFGCFSTTKYRKPEHRRPYDRRTTFGQQPTLLPMVDDGDVDSITTISDDGSAVEDETEASPSRGEGDEGEGGGEEQEEEEAVLLVGSDDVGGGDDGGGYEPYVPKVVWQHEVDPRDKLTNRHFRHVISFTCSDPEHYSSPSSSSSSSSSSSCEHFIRLTVTGDSFMYNQIRMMVGASMAFAQGFYPPSLLPVLLSPKARITVPIAPSEGLYLSDTLFHPFKMPKTKAGEPAPPPRYLHAGPIALANQREFRERCVLPAVTRALRERGGVWDVWMREELPVKAGIPAERVEEVVRAYGEWREGKRRDEEERMFERQRRDGGC